jgi:non-canonical (house-cleaning) NTP pyrophosphatase
LIIVLQLQKLQAVQEEIEEKEAISYTDGEILKLTKEELQMIKNYLDNIIHILSLMV